MADNRSIIKITKFNQKINEIKAISNYLGVAVADITTDLLHKILPKVLIDRWISNDDALLTWIPHVLFEKKKIRQLEKITRDQKEQERQLKEEARLSLENKQRELKNEEKLARERSHDLRKFIRKEQAILRQEQAEKQRMPRKA